MTAIEFHILNSNDQVFCHHRSEIAGGYHRGSLIQLFVLHVPADVLVLKADSTRIF